MKFCRAGSKKSGIQFYDGSYVKNSSGQFESLDIANDSITPNYATYTDLVSQILGIGFGNTKNISNAISDFREEFNADGYFPFNITVSIGVKTYRITDSLLPENNPNHNTKWTSAGGLNLTGGDLSGGDFIINGIKIFGAGRNKITSVLNPFAPDVDWTPGAKMDVLFVPLILIYQGEASFYNYNAGGSLVVLQSSKRAATVFSDRFYNKQSPYYRKSINGFYDIFRGRATIDDYYAAYRGVLAAQYYGLATLGLVSNTLAFPVPPAYPTPGGSGGGGFAAASLGVGSTNPGDSIPHVVLVIRKDGNLFYVWN